MKAKRYLLIVMFTLSLLVSGIGVEHKIYADEDDIIWGKYLTEIGLLTIGTGTNYASIPMYGTYGIKYEGQIYNQERDEYRDLITLYLKTYANDKAYGRIYLHQSQTKYFGIYLNYYYLTEDGKVCETYTYRVNLSDMNNISVPSGLNWDAAEAYIPEIGTTINEIGTLVMPRPWTSDPSETATGNTVLGCAAQGNTLQSINGYDTTYLAKNMAIGMSQQRYPTVTTAMWNSYPYDENKGFYLKNTSSGNSESIGTEDQDKLAEQQQTIKDAQDQVAEYDELEQQLVNDNSETLDELDFTQSSEILTVNSFTATSNWVRTRYAEMINGTPFEAVLLLSLAIGFALYVIGRMR